jgi:hypothetical protein
VSQIPSRFRYNLLQNALLVEQGGEVVCCGMEGFSSKESSKEKQRRLAFNTLYVQGCTS